MHTPAEALMRGMTWICQATAVKPSAICALGASRPRRTTPPHSGGSRMRLLIAFEASNSATAGLSVRSAMFQRLLTCVLQGCSPICRWKGRYDGQAPVSTVLADLCSHCGLSQTAPAAQIRPSSPAGMIAAEPRLWCMHARDVHMHTNVTDVLVLQVCKHQAKLLELTASFRVTVAFFIWYSFSWGNVKKHEILATIWQRSVEHRISIAAMYKEEMSQFLDLHHKDEIPLVALQHSGYPHAAVDSAQELQQDSSCVGLGILFFLNSMLQLKVDMGIDSEAAFTPWDDNFCHFCQPYQPTDADLVASLSLSDHY